jgi:lipopolysaccharide/colanic/teichoic acid biosynthesis glycosyltransferase
VKRAFDFFLAAAMAVPVGLVTLLLCAVSYRETGGQPLFLQTRVGRGQRPFTLVKLRTMAVGTANVASHEVNAEAVITPSGRWMRRFKLDELPQIWNVLLGDMSFVGPRPCLPNQHELIGERAARDVFAMRPGITGLAQVQGVDMSTPRQLAEIDARYASERTFIGDLKLLAQTFVGSGRGDAARKI